MTYLGGVADPPKIHYNVIVGSRILVQNFLLRLGSRYNIQIRDGDQGNSDPISSAL